MTIEAQEIAERSLRSALAPGACIALVDEVSSIHARFVGMGLTSSSETRHRRLTLATVDGMNVGVATRTGIDSLDSLRSTVDAARAASIRLPHEPQLVPGDECSTTDSWGKPPAGVGAQVLTGLAERLSAMHGTTPSAQPHGFAEQRVTTTYLATSAGLRLCHEQSSGVLDLSWIPRDGGTATWVGARAESLAGIRPSSLRPITRLFGNAPLRRASLRPGRHDVILTSSCMADLMHHLYAALGAQEALDGQGPFAGPRPLGDRLTRVPLTLRSDPDERHLRCASFLIARGADQRTSVLDNGLALRPTRWIANGSLTALVHTRETAHRCGQPPTAAIDNLVLEAPDPVGGIEALVARTERGVLVNSLWYLRPVDRQRLVLTGLTRDGVYLIERGEITAELPDFRFNESPLDLLGRICEVGQAEPTLPREWPWVPGRMAMPAVRVNDFQVAAVSA